jgi:hypothetical protein
VTRNMRMILATSVLVTGLSACGDSNGQTSMQPVTPSTPPVATPPPKAASAAAAAAQISSCFGAIFARDRNSEPVDPAPNCVGPVNSSAEPIDF